ncbi:MAG: methyltransferase domain-containing protein [Chlorobiaceae bacterium]|nr:methyltransferase domain-containing protein [Chlorobiaceae bacterium]
MEDVYATIAQSDPTVQERIAGILELRASDPQQEEFLDSYLKSVPFPDGAKVLEIGCGTGPVSRAVSRLGQVSEVVGIDPSPVLLDHALALGAEYPGLSHLLADARELPFEEHAFDAIILHTSLCHIPGADRVLAEAFRVAKPEGLLVVFDGDYAATSLAIDDNDPLEAVARAAVKVMAYDRWLVRKLPGLLLQAGFEVVRSRAFAYSAACDAAYMLTILDRGADALEAAGVIGANLAAALKEEGRERADNGKFFGLISYGNMLARKPQGA